MRVILEVLNELVPSDSLAFIIANILQPNKATFVALPEDNASPENLALISQYMHESPFAAYYLATRDANWKMISDFMPVEDFHKTNLHRLALGPVGVNHQIFSYLGALGDTGYSMVLNRTRGGFTEREREILNTIHPHLVNSFVNAAVHSRAQNSLKQVKATMETAPGAYDYFNAEGQLSWLQERAESWLQEFFNDEVSAEDNVPHSIRQLVSRSSQDHSTPQTLKREGATEWLIHNQPPPSCCRTRIEVHGHMARRHAPNSNYQFSKQLLSLKFRHSVIKNTVNDGVTDSLEKFTNGLAGQSLAKPKPPDRCSFSQGRRPG